MRHDLLTLTKRFVSIPSTSDNPEALEKVLDLALSKVRGYTIERFERKGIPSALVYRAQKRPERFKVILNGHLDVIPGKAYQYVPRVKGRRLYGVGAMDMKANVACLITAFKEVADNVDYPLGLQLVTDEEAGGFNGTQYQIERGVRADFVLAGEPTNFDIVHKTKGILWVKVSAKGISAHGAYPWRGENAIWNMHAFLDALKLKYPVPPQEAWATTVNVAKIETNNQAMNKIPDGCVVWLDVRYIPDEASTIVRNMRQLLPKGCLLEVIVKEPALSTHEDNEYVQALRNASGQISRRKVSLRGAQGSSDARHFTRVGCAGVEFGPIGGGIGSDREWVDIPGLQTYQRILERFLASPSGTR